MRRFLKMTLVAVVVALLVGTALSSVASAAGPWYTYPGWGYHWYPVYGGYFAFPHYYTSYGYHYYGAYYYPSWTGWYGWGYPYYRWWW